MYHSDGATLAERNQDASQTHQLEPTYLPSNFNSDEWGEERPNAQYHHHGKKHEDPGTVPGIVNCPGTRCDISDPFSSRIPRGLSVPRAYDDIGASQEEAEEIHEQVVRLPPCMSSVHR
jgi:hypothetical protein